MLVRSGHARASAFRGWPFRIGAIAWIAIGIGHAALVDVLTVALEAPVFELVPDTHVFRMMRDTTLSYGFLGESTVFRAASGFSIWLGFSLCFMGASNLLIAAASPDGLRHHCVLGFFASVAFFALAFTCFIIPPTVASAIATAAYGVAWTKTAAPATLGPATDKNPVES